VHYRQPDLHIAAKDTGAEAGIRNGRATRPRLLPSEQCQPRKLTKSLPVPALSPDASETDEIWFADLRLLVPMSKLSVGCGADSGSRDGDALKFAATIAHRFSRPALQEVLSEAVPESIDKHILETKKRSSAYTQTRARQAGYSKGRTAFGNECLSYGSR